MLKEEKKHTAHENYMIYDFARTNTHAKYKLYIVSIRYVKGRTTRSGLISINSVVLVENTWIYLANIICICTDILLSNNCMSNHVENKTKLV